MRPRCGRPRRSWRLEHNQWHGPFNFFPPLPGSWSSGFSILADWLCGYFTDDHFVDVAPDPVFAGLNRADHRVFGVMKMFCGVLVLRRVAAAHMATDPAHAQGYPGIACLY